jgi:putative flavoprotein involved in K+ transport
MTLLGRLAAMHGTRVWLAPDLHVRLGEADATYAAFRRSADAHVAAAGIDLPADQPPPGALLRDGFAAPLIRDLDLAVAGYSSVVWATGFRHDFSPVHLPVFDAAGYPITERGVTSEPGLYIVGARWQVPGATTLVGRIGVEAAHVAEVIASR